MTMVLTIWLIGMPVAYFVFRSRRVSALKLAAGFWPIMIVVLLAASLSNPNSPLRNAGKPVTEGHSSNPPSDQAITRPRYGLIDTADDGSGDQPQT